MVVKRHTAGQSDTQTADTFRNWNVDVAKKNGANCNLLPTSCTGADDNRFRPIPAECKPI